MSTPDHEVIIVGAGFAGIGAGFELKRAGIEDFVLLERAGDIGGTWRDNTYPGLAVDIPSFNFDEHGDAPWQRPSSVLAARWRSRRFDLDDYSYA